MSEVSEQQVDAFLNLFDGDAIAAAVAIRDRSRKVREDRYSKRPKTASELHASIMQSRPVSGQVGAAVGGMISDMRQVNRAQPGVINKNTRLQDAKLQAVDSTMVAPKPTPKPEPKPIVKDSSGYFNRVSVSPSNNRRPVETSKPVEPMPTPIDKQELLEEDQPRSTPSHPIHDHESQPVLSFKGVSKMYGKGRKRSKVIGDVSFEVRKGELAGLLCRDDNRKNTILDLIEVVDTPSEGVVSVNFKDTSTFSKSQVDDLRLSTVNIVSSLKFKRCKKLVKNLVSSTHKLGRSRKTLTQKANDLIQLVDLGSAVNLRPGKLSTLQRQRLAVAKSLMNNPQLIVIDTQSIGLDTNDQAKFIETLQEVREKTTVTILVISNDKEITEALDRTVDIQ